EACGGTPRDFGIARDDRDGLRTRLKEAAASADVVLSSGGVSVGTRDTVKDVILEIGTIELSQVAMQPGRPIAFGTIDRALLFGLPGNPVAAMIGFLMFVRPALFKLEGRTELFAKTYPARATERIRKKVGRRELKRGVFSVGESGFEVRLTGPQGSGILT